VSYQLRNQNDPQNGVQFNTLTWFGVLELAQEYGWNPMGTVHPNGFELAGFEQIEFEEAMNYSVDPHEWPGDYWGNMEKLVLIEDALNLADALEEAFLDYEPVRLPALHGYWPSNVYGDVKRSPPSIGAIKLLARFCQDGAFYIARCDGV